MGIDLGISDTMFCRCLRLQRIEMKDTCMLKQLCITSVPRENVMLREIRNANPSSCGNPRGRGPLGRYRRV